MMPRQEEFTARASYFITSRGVEIDVHTEDGKTLLCGTVIAPVRPDNMIDLGNGYLAEPKVIEDAIRRLLVQEEERCLSAINHTSFIGGSSGQAALTAAPKAEQSVTQKILLRSDWQALQDRAILNEPKVNTFLLPISFPTLK